MKTVITLYALFVAITTGVLSPAVSAAEQPRQRVVNYSDLNLNHASGAKSLYLRISAAARAVCVQPSAITFQQKAAARECYTKAISDAVRDVNNVNLTAYHLERTGQGSSSEEKLAVRK